MITLSVRQFATVKRVAQNVNPLVIKVEKLKEKIVEFQKEIEQCERIIEGNEYGIKEITGGYSSSELVKKQVETIMDENGNPKVDKNGSVMKATKWVPSSIVTKDEEKNVYVIEEPTSEEPPVDDNATYIYTGDFNSESIAD